MLALPQLPSAERPASRNASPPPAANTTTTTTTTGPRFADLLQRGQVTHGVLAQPVSPPLARLDPPPRERSDRDRDAAVPADTQRARLTAAAKANAKAAQPRDKAATAAPPQPAAPSPAATADAANGEERGPRRTADEPGTGIVPGAGLHGWLAPSRLQDAAPADLAGHDIADASNTAPGLGRDSVAKRASNAAEAADAANAGEDAPAGDTAAHAALGGVGSAAAASELAAAEPAERRTALPEPASPREAPPALLSGAAGAVPRGFDPATLAPTALPTPLHSPDFAQALGAQVSVFVRDGVQQAELHLNPADMGPISVQIGLDGTQARVDFSADAAVTREIIERGLPELASALREQGFTLSGGGVFQRAPEQRDPGSAAANAGRSKRLTATSGGAVSTSPTPRPAAQGLLDLYV